jgi:hypothetical protein
MNGQQLLSNVKLGAYFTRDHLLPVHCDYLKAGGALGPPATVMYSSAQAGGSVPWAARQPSVRRGWLHLFIVHVNCQLVHPVLSKAVRCNTRELGPERRCAPACSNCPCRNQFLQLKS